MSHDPETESRPDLPPITRSRMRVRLGAQPGRRGRVEYESEALHAGADQHEAAGSGGRAGEGPDGGGGLPEDRYYRTDVLSLAQGVRGPASGPGEAAEGVGEGERPVEEGGGRPGAG